MGEPRLGTEQHPRGEGKNRHDHDGGHEDGRDFVGQTLDRCAAALGLSHEVNNLGKQCVAAHTLRSHDKAAGAINRSSRDRVARSFLHWDGFARDHGLIDTGMPVDDGAIDGNFLAGPDAE